MRGETYALDDVVFVGGDPSSWRMHGPCCYVHELGPSAVFVLWCGRVVNRGHGPADRPFVVFRSGDLGAAATSQQAADLMRCTLRSDGRWITWRQRPYRDELGLVLLRPGAEPLSG